MKIKLMTKQPEIYADLVQELTQYFDIELSSQGGAADAEILLLTDDFFKQKAALQQLLKQKTQILAALVTSQDAAQRIKGLQAGIDIFWEWPMTVEELTARLQNLIQLLNGIKAEQVFDFYQGELMIFPESHEVVLQGENVTLTASEYQLLRVFAAHPYRIYAREELLTLMENERGTSRAIDTHIKNLRRKLAQGSFQSRYIRTVHGRGYRFLEKENETK